MNDPFKIRWFLKFECIKISLIKDIDQNNYKRMKTFIYWMSHMAWSCDERLWQFPLITKPDKLDCIKQGLWAPSQHELAGTIMDGSELLALKAGMT